MNGVELAVISHGFTEIVKLCLKDAKMLHYFTHESKTTGARYLQVWGKDSEVMHKKESSKLSVMQQLVRDRKLNPDLCMLVDDDIRNCEGARDPNKPKEYNTCSTYCVWGGRGMTTTDIERIRAWSMPTRHSHADLYDLQKQTVDPRPYLASFEYNELIYEDPPDEHMPGHFIIEMKPHFNRDPIINSVMTYYTVEAKFK